MKRIIIEVPEDFDGYISGNHYPQSYTYSSYSDPCEHCNNNPKNNPLASGVCSCVLPYLNNPIY